MSQTWSFDSYLQKTHQIGMAFFQANAAILSITDMSTTQTAAALIHQCLAFLANDSIVMNRVIPPPPGTFWKQVHGIERGYDYVTGAYLARRLRELSAEVKLQTGTGQPATVAGVAQRNAICLFLKKVREETGYTLERLVQDMDTCLTTYYKDFVENPDKIDVRVSNDMMAYCIGLAPMLPPVPR